MPHEEKEIQKCLIDKCPDQLKLPFALWPRKTVTMLIKELFDIDMAVRTVGSYLQRCGFTHKKPVKRAYERNDKHVNSWLNEEYPAIALKAKQEGAEYHNGKSPRLSSAVRQRQY